MMGLWPKWIPEPVPQKALALLISGPVLRYRLYLPLYLLVLFPLTVFLNTNFGLLVSMGIRSIITGKYTRIFKYLKVRLFPAKK